MQGRSISLEMIIGQPEFTRGAANDPPNGGIVRMAHGRKEMMFDLMVQAAAEPVPSVIEICKVCGGSHLMGAPSLADGGRNALRRREFHALHLMRHDEHQPEREAEG